MTDKMLSEKYITTTVTPDELKKRLGKLHKYLSERSQESGHDDLDVVAASLVQKQILKHKDKDIKILVACCLSDIIRVYAPDAPFGSEQLREVFKLFIEQIKEIADVGGSLFLKYYYLLEKLSVVRAFILISEDSELIEDLFNGFFGAISSEHATAVKVFMLDVMISVIEESDSIQSSLLEVIFMQLIEKHKNKNVSSNPAAFQLAQNIISRCSNKLNQPISQYLLESKGVDSELHEYYHDLLYELYKISASFLTKVLPDVENDVKVENADIRFRATKCLVRLIAAKNSQLAQNFKLVNDFLRRFNDKEAKIRRMMAEFARHYLINHSHNLSDVDAKLRERLQDPEEEVRKAAVDAACEVAEAAPDHISENTMLALRDRLRDKKELIRFHTVQRLATLYSSIYQKLGEDWKDKDLKKFGWIPTRILMNYWLPDVEDRFEVERALDEVLLGELKDTEEHRAYRLTQLYTTLVEAKAKEALVKLLQDRKGLQDDFLAIVEDKKKNGADSEDIERRVRNLASKMPKSHECETTLNKTLKLKDSSQLKLFVTLADPDSSYSEVISSRAELHKKSKGEGNLKLVDKLGVTTVNKDFVPFIFKYLKAAQKSDPKGLGPILSLLELIAEIYPSFYKESYDTLSELIVDDNEALVDTGLSILSHAGKLLGEKDSSIQKDKNLRERLTSLCLEGSVLQAKLAVRTISQIYPKPENLFSRLVDELTKHLSVKDKRLLAVLKSLGQIAKYSNSSFDSKKTEFSSFLETLLTHSDKTSKGGDEPSSNCQAKILGIKVLYHFFFSQKEVDEEGVQFLILLFKILQSGGEISKDSKMGKSDRAFLRLAVVNCILRLCTKKEFEEAIDPENFLTLSLMIQDPDSDVRRAVIEKLHKVLQTLKVPVGFLSIFAFAATDSDKDNVALAKLYLSANIKQRRSFVKSHENVQQSSALQTLFLPEYSLPYLVHIIAHHPDLQGSEKSLMEASAKYLQFFLEHIFSSDNFIFLIHLLDGINQTKDKQSPESTNIHTVASQAVHYVRKKSNMKSWNEKHPGHLVLPKKFFELLKESEARELQKKMSATPYVFPEEPPKKNPILEAPEEKEKEKSKSKSKEDEDSDGEKKKKKTPKKTPASEKKKAEKSSEKPSEKKGKRKKPEPEEKEPEDSQQEKENTNTENQAKETPKSTKKAAKPKKTKEGTEEKPTKKPRKSKKAEEKEQENSDKEQAEPEEKEKKTKGKKGKAAPAKSKPQENSDDEPELINNKKKQRK